ncbi:hypothetical protein FHU37_004802 [Allostreptomyces psammosilenae]|uniref:Uncharacterized protein n=1 Tax=Allostreptomyces psammosilenae TaxID=1892865 RepID=A0A852ZZG8_9ACTN|nr:hypothetical protein [Allostreptomyces psammosilenae]
MVVLDDEAPVEEVLDELDDVEPLEPLDELSEEEDEEEVVELELDLLPPEPEDERLSVR